MDLTTEDWQEWAAHPCTKAMTDLVQEEIDARAVKSVCGQTIDETVANAYKRDGFMEGMEAFADLIEEVVGNES